MSWLDRIWRRIVASDAEPWVGYNAYCASADLHLNDREGFRLDRNDNRTVGQMYEDWLGEQLLPKGDGLTPEEQAEFDSIADRWKP